MLEVNTISGIAGADIPGYFSLAQAYVIQNWAFAAGVFVGLALVYFWQNWRWVIPALWRKLSAAPSKETTRTALALLLVVFVMAAATGANAQTATPIPPTATSTPGLTIPINTVMTSTNSWIETFAPIAAIGIGIGIALAILGYLGRIIKSAFD
jgi:hypothetical protein